MQIRLDPPALVIVSERGLADWQAGAARGPVVIVRPGYEADLGLLAHELYHVSQWWLIGLFGAALVALIGACLDLALFGGAMPLWALCPAGLALNSMLYLLWPSWRGAEEIRAYRVQAQCYPDDRRPLFAEFIASSYGLDITAAEALQKLREGEHG